ncbi:MAG: TAXI family TRAP transporter solute-binding subunit [Deferrisomatales bacterium]
MVRAQRGRTIGTALTVLGVAAAVALGGASPAAAAGQDYKITIVGGSAGGVWSVITEGVAESIRRALPEARVTTEPGKDGPNQVMVSKGEVQLAVTYDATNYAGVHGLVPYKDKLANLRTVAVLNPISCFQFFVDQKTGLTSFKDIAAKKYPLKVGANRKGTLMHLSGEAVLAAYGAPYDKLEGWGGKIQYVPNTQALDLWDAGQLDAAQEVAQFPASQYLEHGKKHNLRLLCLDEDKVAELSKTLGMAPFTMPANSYAYQPEACRTLNTKLTLLTSADQPEQLVYDVVKAMNQSLAYLQSVHANLRELTPQVMSHDVMVDLHPGAARYYREVGALR